MSKGQRGNKEAKKPKKSMAPTKPIVPGGAAPKEASVEATRFKK
jgi:hypothetical protein